MYISIDNTAQVVLQLGRGTLSGIKARCIRPWSTYWPSATHLLLHSPSLIYSHWWCSWVGEVEGTRCSENIWVRGIQLDFSLCWRFFIFSGSPTSSQYSVAMGYSRTCMHRPWTLPLKQKQMAFLSVFVLEFDIEAIRLHLPLTKFNLLRQEVQTWPGRKWCMKCELLSPVRSLQHAASVVNPGSAFVRRMIDLSTTYKTKKQRFMCLGNFDLT